MFSSYTTKFSAEQTYSLSSDHFHTNAVVPSSDHFRTDTVVPPSDHYCIETVSPSGDHYCINIVVPSSDQLVTNVKEKSAQAGLYLNLKNTKVMSTEEIEEFELDGENIAIVRDFVFLGAKTEDSGSCKGEILRRLALGRAAMTGLNKIWKDKDITITTKCRIVNALVFPVVLYGCESWTIRKVERRRIDSFELWCWRRLLRIPWTARRTNKSVIEEIKPTNPLEAQIKKQQLSYFGHIMRSENSLEKSMMLGMGG